MIRLALIGALLLLLAGCGVRPTDPITGDQAPAGAAPPLRFYLWSGQELVLVTRPTKSEAGVLEALTALTASPSEDESARGLTTEIPPGTTLVYVDGTVSTSTPLSTRAAEQIACTVLATAPDGPTPALATPNLRRDLSCGLAFR